ncbi:MAG: flagellin lysine-N-methylase [Clostridia bacterium]|nr:flagellin lysine-N-methylase [Clostridia bacterium]
MKLIVPDYHPDFHCIADRCRHSCCIGWEIDIDPATREKYRLIPGDFGARLNAAIQDGNEVSTFRLGEGERCPMLNRNGLCDLITELGEGSLCQICADHPRFRSFFPGRTELGLGLCCEEAARLILTREKPMKLIVLEDDGTETPMDEEDECLLAIHDTLICTLQEDMPLQERLDELLLLGGLTIPEQNWTEVYRGLERLDSAWDAALDSLDNAAPQPPAELENAFVRFCEYMLYRHLPGAMEDEDIPGRVAFCVLSTRVLMALCDAKPGCTMEDCIEFARMYSAEIEYSEENISALLDALWEE